jgi:hypothetical protein
VSFDFHFCQCQKIIINKKKKRSSKAKQPKKNNRIQLNASDITNNSLEKFFKKIKIKKYRTQKMSERYKRKHTHTQNSTKIEIEYKSKAPVESLFSQLPEAFLLLYSKTNKRTKMYKRKIHFLKN